MQHTSWPDVHHCAATVLGAGPVALFGVATLTADNRLVVRSPDGLEIAMAAGRVDPQGLARLLLRKLWRSRQWWS